MENKIYISFGVFPNSQTTPFEETSPSSRDYNCIAWAMEDATRFYWPLPDPVFYWPADVKKE